MVLGNGIMLSTNDQIHVFSKQMPPFTMLAVTAKDNQIAVFHHSISQLSIPPGFNHKKDNDILAFMNDVNDLDSLPTIVKLDRNDLDSDDDWLLVDIMTVMNTGPVAYQVLLVPNQVARVSSHSQVHPDSIFLSPTLFVRQHPKKCNQHAPSLLQ